MVVSSTLLVNNGRFGIIAHYCRPHNVARSTVGQHTGGVRFHGEAILSGNSEPIKDKVVKLEDLIEALADVALVIKNPVLDSWTWDPQSVYIW
jgi:hypothetical protein